MYYFKTEEDLHVWQLLQTHKPKGPFKEWWALRFWKNLQGIPSEASGWRMEYWHTGISSSVGDHHRELLPSWWIICPCSEGNITALS